MEIRPLAEIEIFELTAASPQTPRSGGTDSALRLSSPARTGLFHPRPTLTPSRGRAAVSGCSLRFPFVFVFLLDFLLVVPNIERSLSKKIKRI